MRGNVWGKGIGSCGLKNISADIR